MPSGAIITTLGLTKLASATPLNQLNISALAVGDGNGGYPALTPSMTALTNEVWRGTPSPPIRDPNSPNVLIFEAVIPPSVGGFTVREQAIFDDAGDMIAIGQTSVVEKPLPNAATGVILTVRLHVQLDNAEQVDLFFQDDPTISAVNVKNESGGSVQDFIDESAIKNFELYRRSYAEAGYNLVDGSFEQGGTLVNTNDVLLQDLTGKAFSGPAGTVAAGTNPASGGGFVDRSDDIRVSGSIDAIQFGVDNSGALASDAQLLAALQFSATTGIEIVVSGKCRLTQTMLQPANSIVRVDGIVFCENPAGLANNLLWDVSGPNDTGCRTEIRTITLSTSPTTGSAVVDRLMKPLRISTARVKCGLIKTYGFQLGGPEIGPTGYEISVSESVSIIKKWHQDHRDSCGFKITTTDCQIGNVITTNYPVGPQIGSTNHVKSVHCWGLPATIANEYPNAQLLTGPKVGTASFVDYMYVDTPDTEFYDTVSSGDDGVGLLLSGFESRIGSLLYRIHPQTKPNKVKLARLTGHSNLVDCLQVPSGTGFDTTNPIIYDNDSAKWRNRINSSNVHSNVNVFQYGVTLVPSGFTTFTGYVTVEKISHDVVIRLYLEATAVDNSSTSDFVINLPAGLTLMQGSTTIVSQRTCLAMPITDHTLTHDFAYVDNQSKIRIGYRKRDTGQMFFLKQTSLRPGNIELVLRASITNQM